MERALSLSFWFGAVILYSGHPGITSSVIATYAPVLMAEWNDF